MKHLTCLLLISLLCQIPLGLSAQVQEQLILKNPQTEKVRTVGHNKKIKVVKLDGSRIKGRLLGIDSTILYLSSGNIPLKEIDFIRIKFLGTQIAGYTLAAIGTAGIGLGGVVVVAGVLADDPLSLLVGLLIGSVLVVSGVLVDVIGLPLSQLGRKFYLKGNKAWIIEYE